MMLPRTLVLRSFSTFSGAMAQQGLHLHLGESELQLVHTPAHCSIPFYISCPGGQQNHRVHVKENRQHAYPKG